MKLVTPKEPDWIAFSIIIAATQMHAQGFSLSRAMDAAIKGADTMREKEPNAEHPTYRYLCVMVARTYSLLEND